MQGQGRAGSEKISVCFDGPVNKLETDSRALTEESPTARELYHVPTSAHARTLRRLLLSSSIATGTFVWKWAGKEADRWRC
jgi:hypothetical protein